MDALNNKCFLVLILYIFLISLTLFEYTSGAGTQCSASDDVKWSRTKQKCVQCPKCHPGQFRNLSEPYTRRTGLHGAEKCIRCRQCPTGTYSTSGYGECIKCRMNCTDFNREIDSTCTNLHDAQCGSCLSGFEDTFKSTLFPCGPKSNKSPRILNPPRKKSDPKQKASATEVGNSGIALEYPDDTKIDDGREDVTDVLSKSSHKSIQDIHHVVIAVIVFGGALVLVTGFVTVKVYVRRRNQTTHMSGLNLQGYYSRADDLSNDNDIEMDTFGQYDETLQSGYQEVPQTESSAVRPELGASRSLLPRPELSQPTSSNNCNGMIYIGLPDRPRHVFCFEKYKDICRCRIDQNKRCHCQSYVFSTTVDIKQSDKYVLEVAANVCHDPLPLFRHLCLDDPEIYQENDTRDRDPERISQKDLVINLLHKWIEVKPTPTTLQRLSEALCKANFHNINDKLYKLYDTNDR